MGVPLLDTGTWLAPDPRPGWEKTERENIAGNGVCKIGTRGKEGWKTVQKREWIAKRQGT